jgi:hypothetical protein
MKPEIIRTIRTGAQAAIALIPAVPLIIDKLGISETAGVGAVIVAVAAGAARVMQIPAVDQLVNQLLGKGSIAAAEESQGQ